MLEVRFDTYYRYEELTRILHAYAEEYSLLVRIQSIGKSYAGRNIWLLTLTNFGTGRGVLPTASWRPLGAC